MLATLDYETRSDIKLGDRGAFVYAESPYTDIVCAGVKVDNGPALMYIPDYFKDLIDITNIQHTIIPLSELLRILTEAETIIAHNAMFEYLITNLVAVDRYGWPRQFPIERFTDTMAAAAYHALPQSLEKLGEVLGLTTQKDMEGNKAMLRICKPWPAVKAKRERLTAQGYTENEDKSWYAPDGSRFYIWDETPEKLEKTINYCADDIQTTYEAHLNLGPLPASERRIWIEDQKINLRGLHYDRESVTSILQAAEQVKPTLEARFIELTGGQVTSARAYPQLAAWVSGRLGEMVKSVNKDAVKKLMSRVDLPEDVREVLQIKKSLAKASVAKFTAMVDRASVDDRIRGVHQYHEASTGREAGRGVQTQNLPRDSFHPEEYEDVLYFMKQNALDVIRMIYGEFYPTASKCVRGSITAGPGMEFVSSDYSSIEGRVLAWLAGEQWVLDEFMAGKDMYKVDAATVLGKSYEEITKKERQDFGKPANLGCGFGGSVGAIRQFGGGKGMEDHEIKAQYVDPWRQARPKTVAFWYNLEDAALAAVKNPGVLYQVGPIKYRRDRRFLRCFLPSGRVMHYFSPYIDQVEIDIRKDDSTCPEGCKCRKCVWKKDGLFYWGYKQLKGTNKRIWCAVPTYGGKLAENVTQGTARDILFHGVMQLVDHGKYPVVMTVHDEATAEVPIGTGDIDEYNALFAKVPPWAQGLPLVAEGWIGKRYRK